MKKNITINLSGRLFAIDEDAYEMLSTYEQSLRTYFRQREGGEEIAEDIEARIAELFDELKQSGVEAINIEHVREVIHRIGRPSEIAPSDSPKGESTQSTDEQPDTNSSPMGEVGRGRRLYRNPADKKLMGVLSGFAAYFGGDVLWWRLGYVGLYLLAWSAPFIMPATLVRIIILDHYYHYGEEAGINFLLLFLAYIILAALMPVAETPEDRLRMKGKEVNPQNLAEEIAEQGLDSPPALPKGREQIPSSAKENTSVKSDRSLPLGRAGGESVAGGGSPSGCLPSTLGCISGFFSALFAVVATLLRWCIYAFGVFVAVMSLVGFVALSAFALSKGQILNGDGYLHSAEWAAFVSDHRALCLLFVGSALVALFITAYAIIHSLLNEFRQILSMSYWQRIALLVLWLAALVAAGISGTLLVSYQEEANHAYYHRIYRERIRDKMGNEYDSEAEYLQAKGWQVLSSEGCNDRYTAHGEYMTGDRDVRYIDTYDDLHRQRFRIERTDTLAPGTYTLSCAARANGTGACVYAIVGSAKPQFIEIPATGNTGGDIWQKAREEYQRYINAVHADDEGAITLGDVPMPDGIRAMAEANHSDGYGWNRLTFPTITVARRTVLRYGVATDPAFTGHTWQGQWFSATDFETKSATE